MYEWDNEETAKVDFISGCGYYFNCFKKYMECSGRARRSEYWSFIGYHCVVWVIIGVIASFCVNFLENRMFPLMLALVYGLASLCPFFAVTARRLQDVSKNKWWGLLAIFLGPVGILLLVPFTRKDSQRGDNAYGPCPKEFKDSDVDQEELAERMPHKIQLFKQYSFSVWDVVISLVMLSCSIWMFRLGYHSSEATFMRYIYIGSFAVLFGGLCFIFEEFLHVKFATIIAGVVTLIPVVLFVKGMSTVNPRKYEMRRSYDKSKEITFGSDGKRHVCIDIGNHDYGAKKYQCFPFEVWKKGRGMNIITRAGYYFWFKETFKGIQKQFDEFQKMSEIYDVLRDALWGESKIDNGSYSYLIEDVCSGFLKAVFADDMKKAEKYVSKDCLSQLCWKSAVEQKEKDKDNVMEFFLSAALHATSFDVKRPTNIVGKSLKIYKVPIEIRLYGDVDTQYIAVIEYNGELGVFPAFGPAGKLSESLSDLPFSPYYSNE